MKFLRKLREILHLPQSRAVVSIPPIPERTGEDWYYACVIKSKGNEYSLCPWDGCAGTLLDGPSGGMSTNVKCDTCERKWNMTPAISRMDRI